MLFLHWLERVDPEITSGSPRIDRFQMISKAAPLIAVAAVALFAWGAFFAQFCAFYVAVPLTLVVVIIIVMIDQFLGSSRWFLQGVLRMPGKGRRELLSAVLILRLFVAVILSYATSSGAMMAMCARDHPGGGTKREGRRECSEADSRHGGDRTIKTDDARHARRRSATDEGRSECGRGETRRRPANA